MKRAELASVVAGLDDPRADRSLDHGRLTDDDMVLVARATFLCLATTDARGRHMMSHGAGAPGFVRIVDDRSLLVPEHPGTGCFEWLSSILDDPWVSLLLVVPGEAEALEIRGKASLTTDPRLLAHLTQDGRTPSLALFLEIRNICRRGSGLPATAQRLS